MAREVALCGPRARVESREGERGLRFLRLLAPRVLTPSPARREAALLALAVSVIRLRLLGLLALGRRFHSIRLPPSLASFGSFARFG